MEILSNPTPDMLTMPRFGNGAIDIQELHRLLAEQAVNAVMDAEADQPQRLPGAVVRDGDTSGPEVTSTVLIRDSRGADS